MSDAFNIFGFQIHHIFPNELFADEGIGDAFRDLFAGIENGLTQDMGSNTIALYANAGTAAQIQAALALGNTTFEQAGIGGAHHYGNHPGYNQFVIDATEEILTDSNLTAEKVSELLCMSKLAHASPMKEHDNNDDIKRTTGRAAERR